MAVITNSTYDGVCYHVGAIKEQISDAVDALHFDEAWLAYSGFHPLYDDHHALSKASPAAHHPIVFSTQSTHKLLAAFSQAAMIHIRDSQTQTIDRHRFNDAFMMHTSTSPNYPIIASLDVASRMMAGAAGNAIVQDTIDEAITFRRIMREKFDELASGDW